MGLNSDEDMLQMNEFRSFMGLRRECFRFSAGVLFRTCFAAYESFSEWNPDPEIHVCFVELGLL